VIQAYLSATDPALPKAPTVGAAPPCMPGIAGQALPAIDRCSFAKYAAAFLADRALY
jgi:hypothetical protein